jgi:hypothetical protein
MDTKVKKQWLKALRSGNYTQGQNRLAQRKQHSKTMYCCLGVLCDITPDLRRRRVRHVDGIVAFADAETFLPSDFAQKIGLDQDAQIKLANLNDGGEDFNTIAHYIEENL